MPPTRIFLRDDDVAELTPALRAFVGATTERGLPVSYQIIPERFTPECAAFMLDAQARHPGLVEFGQHGLRHEMVVNGKLEFYEFGPERSYKEQLADIEAGQALLRERLGATAPLRLFTPPRHRYDRNTLRALKAAGFSILSASSYTSGKHRLVYAAGRALGLTNVGRPGVPWHERVRPDSGLFELSIAIAIDDGGTIRMTVDQVLEGVAQARRQTGAVGLMTHHQCYVGEGGASFMSELVDRLCALPDVSFHTIGGLRDQLSGHSAA